MTTTVHDQVATLSAELDQLTHGEVKHVFASAPTEGAARWTITAFGKGHTALADDAAYGLLVAWSGALRGAQARPLTPREVDSGYRVELYRTASGKWRVATQTLAGIVDGDDYLVGDADPISAVHTLAGDFLRQGGYTRLWGWALAQDQVVAPQWGIRYVTIATKD